MLRLTNINRQDDFIEANYIPENSNELGYLRMALSDSEVLQKETTSFDGITKTYFVMAREKLKRVMHEVSVPSECLVMWY